MGTKCGIARKVADEGVAVVIARGDRPNVLVDIIRNPGSVPHTLFEPSTEPLSNIKRWIAHSDSFAKGVIRVNAEAASILRSDRAVSLLPVGVTAIEGEWEEGDIVNVYDPEGRRIAAGRSAMSRPAIRLFRGVRDASRVLLTVPDSTRSAAILTLASLVEDNIGFLLEANRKDLALMVPENPLYDRLQLTEDRLRAIAADLRHVASLPCPVGEEVEHRTLPNGIDLRKVRVPFGVIGVIYEARPDVTFDVRPLMRLRRSCSEPWGTWMSASPAGADG